MDPRKTARKATLLSSLGAGLEYYDFIIYGMMAEYLSPLFFSGDRPWIALIKTFAIFAVGYLIRPFGGILFGMLGDTYGRKHSFIVVMLLMAISTFSIGLLPTYDQVGALAPCLLVIFRMLQGLSFGAELPGAITIVYEYTEKPRHGSHIGLVISSVGLGSSLAAFILYLLSKNLVLEEILSWGWRIPFLLGGILAIVNYFIRKHLLETPEFLSLQAKKPRTSMREPFLCLIKGYRSEVVFGIGMTFFIASLVIFALYLPAHLAQHFKYAPSDVYLAMTLGLLWSSLSLPLSGLLADRFNKRNVLLCTCLTFAVGAIGLFQLLFVNTFIALLTFMIIYQTVISFVMVSYFPLLSESFPTFVRYTGVAACYNITYSVMGCAPIVITAMTTLLQSNSFAVWFLIANALLCATATYLLSQRSVRVFNS